MGRTVCAGPVAPVRLKRGNRFYGNQRGTHVPALGVAAGGCGNAVAGNDIGRNCLPNSVGSDGDFNRQFVFGVAFENPPSTRAITLSNVVDVD
jgi:hypothetical protein